MRRWILSFGVAAFVAVWQLGPGAMAVTAPATGSPGQGLEISPPVIELQADPGQTVTTEVRVRNVTKGELIAKGRVDDFGAGGDETGQPQLLLDETGETRYSLKYWVRGVPDLDLAPLELKKTTVSIVVPANAEPGGHFGVVRFTAVPASTQGVTGVSLSASVGTLILLKVGGQVTDNLGIEEFSTWQKKQQHSFFEYGPIDFLVRLKNDGSVHEKPKGTVTVKDAFGKTVSTMTVNDRGGNVLPGSVRRFEQTYSAKALFGRYTAILNLQYADSKKLTRSISFWVIPWKLIVLGLIGLVALVWVLRLAIHRYNEHIIAQARRRR